MSEPRIVVIAHGRCEIELVEWITTKLNMGIIVDSRNNGNDAIRIENLNEWLSRKCYSNESELHRRFAELEYESRLKNPMPRLKIFVLMDTENDPSAKPFITGDMFSNHPLGSRIVPIYCHSNLDSVFNRLGKGEITKNKISSLRNMLYELEPDEFYELLKSDGNTNLGVFIGYCLDTRPNNQGKRKR